MRCEKQERFGIISNGVKRLMMGKQLYFGNGNFEGLADPGNHTSCFVVYKIP